MTIRFFPQVASLCALVLSAALCVVWTPTLAQSVENHQGRIQSKLGQLGSEVEQLRRTGRNPAALGQIMQQLAPLMRARRFDEAEAVVDRALEMVRQGGASPRAGNTKPPAQVQLTLSFNEPLDGELAVALASGGGFQRQNGLFVLRPGSSVTTTASVSGGGGNPDWCPDGSVVYANGPQIFRWDGRSALALTSGSPTTIIPSCGAQNQVLFSSQTRPDNPRLWIMNNDGSEAQDLGLNRAASMPGWSPDGSWIVYSAASGPSANDLPWEVWRADIARDSSGRWSLSNHQRLAKGSEVSACSGKRDFWFEFKMPVVSPDGRRVVMWAGVEHDASCEDDEDDWVLPRQLWVMNADGSDLRCVPDADAFDGCLGGDGPEWGPAGQIIWPTCTDFQPLCPLRIGRGAAVEFCLGAVNVDGSNRRCIISWSTGGTPNGAVWRR